MTDSTNPPLSPEAEAVLDAARLGAAAILRAAADQVIPAEPEYMRDAGMGPDAYDRSEQIRDQLLAIANELDPQPTRQLPSLPDREVG
jgi:hypothetical protein